MITYICDKCKKEFKQALDQVISNGVKVDLCAPCRKLIQNDIKDYEIKKYKAIKKEVA